MTEDRAIDKATLWLRLDRNYDLWAVAVLERKFGDRAAVAASLARLRHEGLIYEGVYGFVTATRAGRTKARTGRRMATASGFKGGSE